MSKVVFRTADGRVVTFTAGKSKGRRKNPSGSKGGRYRSRSATSRAVDALDAARSASLRAARKASKAKRAVHATAKRKPAVKRKVATKRKTKAGCRTVNFRGGPQVDFCRPAGSDKARKARLGKTLFKKNGLSKFAFVKGKALTAAPALKGKKNGDVFKRGGNTYRMISYVSSAGKRVRYALRVKATAK